MFIDENEDTHNHCDKEEKSKDYDSMLPLYEYNFLWPYKKTISVPRNMSLSMYTQSDIYTVYHPNLYKPSVN